MREIKVGPGGRVVHVLELGDRAVVEVADGRYGMVTPDEFNRGFARVVATDLHNLHGIMRIVPEGSCAVRVGVDPLIEVDDETLPFPPIQWMRSSKSAKMKVVSKCPYRSEYICACDDCLHC